MNNDKKLVHIHTVSDSTGETVQGLGRAVRVHFDNTVQKDWTLIKTISQIEKINNELDENSVVLYSLIDENLIKLLKQCCIKKGSGIMSAMSQLHNIVKNHGGQEDSGLKVGKQHALDDEYFARVRAIDFAVVHDDGQSVETIDKSDIILVGVSRTSKSPTSFYLANRGYKTSNIPFVNGIDLPPHLFKLKNKNVMVVGLTRDAESLINIRRSRLKSLNEMGSTDYVDINKVEEEVLKLKRLCSANGWPVINVGNKSIEETSTQIIKYLERHRDAFNKKKELNNA